MKWPILPIVALVLGISACGGGGSGGHNNNQSGGGNNSSGAAHLEERNPMLSGALYYSDPENYRRLDLKTGVITSLRRGGDGQSASLDGTEFAVVYSKPGDLAILEIFDGDGLTTATFEFENYAFGAPKLSPDGQYVAIGREVNGVNGLSVFDRQGTEVRRINNQEELFINDYEWSQSGTLIFAVNGGLVEISGDIRTTDAIAIFAETLGQTPYSIAVSPDGQKIAYSLSHGEREAHIYVIERGESVARQVTQSDTVESRVTWSPDGRYLAFAHGADWLGSIGGVVAGECPDIVVVPSNAEMLNPESSNVAIYPVVVNDGKEMAAGCPFSSIVWRDFSPYATAVGSPIQGGGANYGLNGTVYFSHGFDFFSLDLASGQENTIFDFEYFGGITPSDDGQEWVGVFENDDYEDWSGIELFDSQGNRNYAFDIQDDVYGRVRLSPDRQYIGVGQDLEDKGRRLTIFGREGTFQGEGLDGVSVQTYTSDGTNEMGLWDWNSDGGLMFVRGRTLYRVAHLGAEPEKITQFPERVKGFELSPNGSKLVIGMQNHLWVLNSDGSGFKKLTTSAHSEYAPFWSPDGKHVVFIFSGPICGNLYVAPVDGERIYVGDELVPSQAVRLSSNCSDGDVSWR